MKKNILLLINGFGVEQRDSYNIYKKELMPNLDRLTVEGLFSTLSSNYLDYKDGYATIEQRNKFFSLTYLFNSLHVQYILQYNLLSILPNYKSFRVLLRYNNSSLD